MYRDLGELVLVALAFLLYFAVRANVIDRPDVALANAQDIIALERSLGLFLESAWQQALIDNRLAVRFFNFVYFWLDFPLIAAVGLVMYARQRPHYRFTRDAMLFSGALALVAYAVFPVAPPRLVPELEIIDTLARFSNLSYQAQSTAFFVNPYAAVPSLHVGWSLLLAVGVARAWPRNRLVVLLALVHPLSQSASTVITGNHYILDGAVGLLVAVAGFSLATLMQKSGYAWLRLRFNGMTERS